MITRLFVWMCKWYILQLLRLFQLNINCFWIYKKILNSNTVLNESGIGGAIYCGLHQFCYRIMFWFVFADDNFLVAVPVSYEKKTLSLRTFSLQEGKEYTVCIEISVEMSLQVGFARVCVFDRFNLCNDKIDHFWMRRLSGFTGLHTKK